MDNKSFYDKLWEAQKPKDTRSDKQKKVDKCYGAAAFGIGVLTSWFLFTINGGDNMLTFIFDCIPIVLSFPALFI